MSTPGSIPSVKSNMPAFLADVDMMKILICAVVIAFVIIIISVVYSKSLRTCNKSLTEYKSGVATLTAAATAAAADCAAKMTSSQGGYVSGATAAYDKLSKALLSGDLDGMAAGVAAVKFIGKVPAATDAEIAAEIAKIKASVGTVDSS